MVALLIQVWKTLLHNMSGVEQWLVRSDKYQTCLPPLSRLIVLSFSVEKYFSQIQLTSFSWLSRWKRLNRVISRSFVSAHLGLGWLAVVAESLHPPVWDKSVIIRPGGSLPGSASDNLETSSPVRECDVQRYTHNGWTVNRRSSSSSSQDTTALHWMMKV